MSQRTEIRIPIIRIMWAAAVIALLFMLLTGKVNLPLGQWMGQMQQWGGHGYQSGQTWGGSYGTGSLRLPVPSQSTTFPSYNPGGATWAPGTGGYAPQPYSPYPSYGQGW